MRRPEYIRCKVRRASAPDIHRDVVNHVVNPDSTTASGCRFSRGSGRSIPGELSSKGRCSLRSFSANARSFQTTIQLNSPGTPRHPSGHPDCGRPTLRATRREAVPPVKLESFAAIQRYLNHFSSVAFSGMCDRNHVGCFGTIYSVPKLPMTQWISSLLHLNGNQHTVAIVKSDGLLLQVLKTPWSRRTQPYVLTLDLQTSQNSAWIRVVEIHGDTPQECAALVPQLLTIARQGLAITQGQAVLANG